MSIPQKVNLSCKRCEHRWLQETAVLIRQDVTIFRDDAKTVNRRVDCPNCGRGVVVKVPKEWLQDE